MLIFDRIYGTIYKDLKFNNIGVRQHFIKEVCYMDKKNSNVSQSNELGINLWYQPEDSSYYDRKRDEQGEVPGRSMEQAKLAFERKYGISLSESKK